ncbi:MAG: HAD-IIIA family hydrolase [Bacteroidetes bacterium]|nr:HAD-IIIA family hydrolase [Bacteroidota bacterium]
MKFTQQIDKTWTLFLDRDGVINHEKNQDYIRSAEEFVFYDNALEALEIFAHKFGLICIVTNQRGIGKGWMSEDDLHNIHQCMIREVEEAGGRIDKIYFAPDLDSDAPHRKPNIGMGLQAQHDFPEIDFKKSIMVGNNLSDMEFGKRLGMKTVYVETTKPILEPNALINLKTNDLYEFSQLL